MSTSTTDIYEKLNKIGDMANELKSSRSKIISSLKACQESIKIQDKKYGNIESQLGIFSNLLSEVVSENKSLRAKIEQLETKIKTVETASSRANVELVYIL